VISTPVLVAGVFWAASLGGCAVSKPAPVTSIDAPQSAFSSQHARRLLDSAQDLQSRGRYAASQEQLEQALGEVSLVTSSDSSLKTLTTSILEAMRNNLPYSLSSEAQSPDEEYDGQMLLDSIDQSDLVAGTVDFGLDTAVARRYREEAMLDSGVVFDLPVEVNDRVIVQLRTFKERIPSTFQRWLERKGRWEMEFTNKLAARGMPQDLIYLAMIESGFNARASSPAAATGIWQFIPSTGRRYGLRVDRFVDERRDPWKATDAALDFLSGLYLRFGDWKLAMAAYNCGEGCIDRAIRRAGHNNYWQLPIPNETRNYVPRVFAAAILGKRPDVHGFNYSPWEPLASDTFTVEGGIPLLKIAEIVGTQAESLALLNPALIKGTTPPEHEPWVVRLPMGTRPRFDSAYLALEKSFEAPQPIRLAHRVRRGETLSNIARRYGVTVASLKSWNRIGGKKVRSGRTLIVYADDLSTKLPSWQEPPMERRARAKVADATPRHKVARGETIQKIARKYDVTVENLMAWNGLVSPKVRSGRSLYVAAPPDDPTLAGIPRTPVPETIAADTASVAATEPQQQDRPVRAASVEHHTVRHGESLQRIARTYDVTVRDLMDWNDLSSTRVNAGARLVVSERAVRTRASRVAVAPRETESKAAPRASAPSTHRIRRGETISTIALRYGVSERELLAANGLRGSHVRAGQKLVIPGNEPVRVAKVERDDAPQVVAPRKPSRPEVQLVDHVVRTTRYTVRPGDTLYSIARALSTTVDTLKQLNGLSRGDIRVGQVIKVPHNT